MVGIPLMTLVALGRIHFKQKKKERLFQYDSLREQECATTRKRARAQELISV